MRHTLSVPVEKACRLLAEAGKRQKRVIEDPPVIARVKQLNDHGVDLEVTVWISDPVLGEGE